MTASPDDSPREVNSLRDILRHIVDAAIDAESSGELRRYGVGHHRGPVSFDYGFKVDIGFPPVEERSTLFEIRPHDDGFTITADVQPATRNDVSLGFDRQSGTLVISTFDEPIERVPLGWSDIEVTSFRVHNGVLDMHIRPNGETNNE